MQRSNPAAESAARDADAGVGSRGKRRRSEEGREQSQTTMRRVGKEVFQAFRGTPAAHGATFLARGAAPRTCRKDETRGVPRRKAGGRWASETRQKKSTQLQQRSQSAGRLQKVEEPERGGRVKDNGEANAAATAPKKATRQRLCGRARRPRCYSTDGIRRQGVNDTV
ncbi:hypothetical protein BESB_067790 [Besnoitia besnoiti]|uniref:Uncharacterized protein n=1 Tax=Besnoitia besnoiti TaxID=94643 RepID=A0A2A9MFK2_BESBE|nr:hypothetical protein BESB_067790 [Besnoitia besnoiti]PFH34746.1 hypothetical protein BESB_067790 [Besnoitia besnoiti]